MKKPTSLAEAAAIAQFKFAIIAPVIQELYPDASRTAYYERITEKPLTLPDGTTAGRRNAARVRLSLPYVREAFYDFDAYVAELRNIHERFREWEQEEILKILNGQLEGFKFYENF